MTCAENAGHVTKNTPHDLKILTTSYLGNFTLGITAFTKCVHVSSGIDRSAIPEDIIAIKA